MVQSQNNQKVEKDHKIIIKNIQERLTKAKKNESSIMLKDLQTRGFKSVGKLKISSLLGFLDADQYQSIRDMYETETKKEKQSNQLTQVNLIMEELAIAE